MCNLDGVADIGRRWETVGDGPGSILKFNVYTPCTTHLGLTAEGEEELPPVDPSVVVLVREIEEGAHGHLGGGGRGGGCVGCGGMRG